MFLFFLSCSAPDTSKACTEIGCTGRYSLQVIGGSGGIAGFVKIAGNRLHVDCERISDPPLVCIDYTLIIELKEDKNPGDVEWALSADSRDTGQRVHGHGVLTPDWTRSQPNGEDCPPICWTAEGTAELTDDR